MSSNEMEVADGAAAHYHDPDVIVGFISHI